MFGRRLPEDKAMLQITIQSTSTVPQTLIDGRVLRAIGIIESKFHSRLTLRTLADQVHLSVFAFVRLFKRETGLSPWQFIMRCRIEASKALLLSTRRAVAQIAYDVGWQNVSHFTAVFRRLVGATPGVFRVKARKQHMLAA
jgi:AraC family transcriptional regulator